MKKKLLAKEANPQAVEEKKDNSADIVRMTTNLKELLTLGDLGMIAFLLGVDKNSQNFSSIDSFIKFFLESLKKRDINTLKICKFVLGGLIDLKKFGVKEVEIKIEDLKLDREPLLFLQLDSEFKIQDLRLLSRVLGINDEGFGIGHDYIFNLMGDELFPKNRREIQSATNVVKYLGGKIKNKPRNLESLSPEIIFVIDVMTNLSKDDTAFIVLFLRAMQMEGTSYTVGYPLSLANLFQTLRKRGLKNDFKNLVLFFFPQIKNKKTATFGSGEADKGHLSKLDTFVLYQKLIVLDAQKKNKLFKRFKAVGKTKEYGEERKIAEISNAVVYMRQTEEILKFVGE